MEQNSLGGASDIRSENSRVSARQKTAAPRYWIMTCCICVVLTVAACCLIVRVFDIRLTEESILGGIGSDACPEITETKMQPEDTEAETPPESTEAETPPESTEAETKPESTGPITQEPTQPSLPAQVEWSAWSDALPDDVDDSSYIIEEQTLYRSRNLVMTSTTTQDTLEGWELFDTVRSLGEFGRWSDWSSTVVSASDTREVETQTRYRYRNKETTTGSASSKRGWTLYDTTSSWSSYGSWSDWSTSAISGSDSRKVESKTQCRYRDIFYSTEYSGWSGWSDWTFDRQGMSDLKKEESRTVWSYYRYVCPRCGAKMHGNKCYSWAGGGCSNTPSISSDRYEQIWSPVSPDAAGYNDHYGTGDFSVIINGETWFVDNGSPHTSDNWSERFNFKSAIQYRYATRSTRQVVNYGVWSGWQDAAVSSSSTREVQKRTVYRYCERKLITTYHFYRWGEWSDWSKDPVTGTNGRQVETSTYYRYRNRSIVTTYYFRRWTEWSDYSTNVVESGDSVKVETKTQYRYKSK